jgi:hypothetical protein
MERTIHRLIRCCSVRNTDYTHYYNNDPRRMYIILYRIYLGENGATEVVGNLAPSVFRPLAIEGLHFKNYQL